MIGIYGVTKTAIIGLTKALGTELGYSGIRVNAIAPAVIKTKFADSLVDTPEAKNNPL
jgi:dehydrogenase/reductase SDR family protein 4